MYIPVMRKNGIPSGAAYKRRVAYQTTIEILVQCSRVPFYYPFPLLTQCIRETVHRGIAIRREDKLYAITG